MTGNVQISIDSIKTLRERTSFGVMDCKRALEKTEGDIEKAIEILREQGIASAAKKASRATNQGLVDTYIHSGGRIGAMIELSCETDFVARTPDFQALAHDVAMQVAAMSPLYINESDIPEGSEADPQQVCLMQQPFIKDPSTTVEDLVKGTIGQLGENVRIRRFTRFALGE